VEATDFVTANPEEAQRLANAAINRITGKPLAGKVIARAWGNLTFTVDPVASSLHESASDAQALGLLPKTADLTGIYDLSILNEILLAAGEEEVAAS
jgi:NitT/TauT family transport system substrate-binding protein